MPRGLDSAFLTAAAANPIRPFQTAEAYFDGGVRRFWDGGTDRDLLGTGTFEGSILLEIGELTVNAGGGAMRVPVTVHAHVLTDLAQALAEEFFGRRARLGRGFFAAGTGLVAGHWWFADGEMREFAVRQESDETVIWRTTIEMGSARGRDVVGPRRTAHNQKALARYLHDDPTYEDTGLRQVAKIRNRPVTWPGGGWIPPDLKP